MTIAGMDVSDDMVTILLDAQKLRILARKSFESVACIAALSSNKSTFSSSFDFLSSNDNI